MEGLGPGLEAGLTTRERSFRYSVRETDPETRRAYAELDSFARPFGGWVRVHQVHGARVVRVGEPGGLDDGVTLGEADGILARAAAFRHPPAAAEDTPSQAYDRPARTRWGELPRLLTVTVADCVPVFLVWPGGYGLLHAGWRGTAAGLLEAGLAESGADPAEVRIHFGPAIGGCCYEVGPEVMEAVRGGRGRAFSGDTAVRSGTGGRWRLDLRAALTARAEAAGVDPTRLTRSASCTACNPRFHSFRASRERSVQRVMLAFLGSVAPGGDLAA